MADVEPGPDNNYQVSPTLTFNRARWNAVMASIAARLKARELLEATFETLIANGTQAALDLISQNVAPQLEDLIEQINALEDQLEDIIGGGTAPNALQLAGQNPSYYLALANATGTLPVEKVTGVTALIDAAVTQLVNGSPAVLDTLKEISDALGGDASFAANMAAALGNRLRVDAVQSLSQPQKLQARQNIGIASAVDDFATAPSLAAARAAIGVRALAVGEVVRGQFTSLPPLCVWANGQNLSRVTFALLLAATTLQAGANVTSGSNGLFLNFFAAGGLTEQVQVGMPIEGPGIPAGATITSISAVTASTMNVTISAAATASNPTATVVIFPNGNGNGTTTFGVADYRDRASVARGNMGGTAAGRLTVFNSSRLGFGGGDQQPAPQNQVGLYGLTNPAGSSWLDMVPGDSQGYGAIGGGTLSGTGTQLNVQPSIIENVAIYAGA